MIHTNPDREDIRDMRDHILLICREKHIPVLKTRCAEDGVWFYTKARPHKGIWLYHFGYSFFVAQGEEKLRLNISLMLRGDGTTTDGPDDRC